MQGVGTDIFTDSYDYQSTLQATGIDLAVTCQGSFKTCLTWAQLPNLHLFRIEESFSSVTFISLPPTRIFVSFPILFDPPPIWDGVDLHPGDIVFHSRGEQMHQRSAGASGWISISLTPEYLATYDELLAGFKLVVPPVGQILRPPVGGATNLRRLLAKACRLAEAKPDIIAHREVARSLEQDLINALVECLSTGAESEHAATRPRHSRMMARFEDSLAKHVERPLHMPELCDAVGVSERTLRTVCADFLGMSPTHYARLRRLNLAHAALRRADPATASVAGLANCYGFTQPGRFAIQYRELFGESPSTTLRRVPDKLHHSTFAESA